MVKLLLIITMVIQPVAIAHAMASMNFSMGHLQHQLSSVIEQNHGVDHAPSQDASNTQHVSHADADNSDMNDSCNTSACCTAALVDISTVEQMPASKYSPLLDITREGVIPPSEIKPPQSLLG